MSIAGHVSRSVLWRYSHVRMEAKRCALDGIAASQRAADEKRLQELERQLSEIDSAVGSKGRPNQDISV